MQSFAVCATVHPFAVQIASSSLLVAEIGLEWKAGRSTASSSEIYTLPLLLRKCEFHPPFLLTKMFVALS